MTDKEFSMFLEAGIPEGAVNYLQSLEEFNSALLGGDVPSAWRALADITAAAPSVLEALADSAPKTPEAKTPEAKTPEAKTPEAEPGEFKPGDWVTCISDAPDPDLMFLQRGDERRPRIQRGAKYLLVRIPARQTWLPLSWYAMKTYENGYVWCVNDDGLTQPFYAKRFKKAGAVQTRKRFETYEWVVCTEPDVQGVLVRENKYQVKTVLDSDGGNPAGKITTFQTGSQRWSATRFVSEEGRISRP